MSQRFDLPGIAITQAILANRKEDDKTNSAVLVYGVEFTASSFACSSSSHRSCPLDHGPDLKNCYFKEGKPLFRVLRMHLFVCI